MTPYIEALELEVRNLAKIDSPDYIPKADYLHRLKTPQTCKQMGVANTWARASLYGVMFIRQPAQYVAYYGKKQQCTVTLTDFLEKVPNYLEPSVKRFKSSKGLNHTVAAFYGELFIWDPFEQTYRNSYGKTLKEIDSLHLNQHLATNQRVITSTYGRRASK